MLTGAIYAVPGVPYEMKEMVLGTVIPDLRARSGDTSVIASRVIRTWGQSESGLAEILADRIEDLDAAANPHPRILGQRCGRSEGPNYGEGER